MGQEYDERARLDTYNRTRRILGRAEIAFDTVADPVLKWWELKAIRNRQLGFNKPPEYGDEIYKAKPPEGEHLRPCNCQLHRDDRVGRPKRKPQPYPADYADVEYEPSI